VRKWLYNHTFTLAEDLMTKFADYRTLNPMSVTWPDAMKRPLRDRARHETVFV